MVDVGHTEGAKAQGQRVEQTRAHNTKVENYQPWFERWKPLALHSRNLIEKAGLNRPNLKVTEFGTGPYSVFRRRALSVVNRGGVYNAIDLDQHIVDQSRQAMQQDTKSGSVREQIFMRSGNSNDTLTSLGVPFESQDVTIINSVAANATPQECRSMLDSLRAQLPQRPDDAFLPHAVAYLERFVTGLPQGHDTAPIDGVNGNILVLLNGLLALKPGGRLVYAQQDATLSHGRMQQVRDMVEAMGIPHESTILQDPAYNMLNLTDIVLMRPGKFDMGVLTADKPTYTSEASPKVLE